MGLEKVTGLYRFGKIGVLMGGPSTEREISLKSGKAVYEALKQSGLEAEAIDIKTESIEENISLIKSHKIDCAFIALHGRFGEDGQIQGILDGLKIPYTCSGAQASKSAMDKVASLEIFESNGLKVPRYRVLEIASYSPDWKIHNELGFPLVIKPAAHGSSIGLSIVDDSKDLDKAVDLAFGFDPRVVVQEYIAGREITVGILEERALPVIEIIPKKRFFDFEAKYQAGMTDYIVPAQIEEAAAKKARAIALSAHRLLGCAGCSRVDMILDKDSEVFVLEINTIPGLTNTSLLPKAAKTAGIEFNQLCLKLIELAYAKK
jgi:D-alanine-D-alanine ligase